MPKLILQLKTPIDHSDGTPSTRYIAGEFTQDEEGTFFFNLQFPGVANPCVCQLKDRDVGLRTLLRDDVDVSGLAGLDDYLVTAVIQG